jgi:hypothetical protein
VEVVEPEASFQRAHRCFGVVLGGAIDTCVCCGEATIYVRLRYYMRRGGELVVGEAAVCAEDHFARCGLVCALSPSAPKTNLSIPLHHSRQCALCFSATRR